MIELFSYSLSYQSVIIIAGVSLLIGMGKAGVYGCGMIAVPLLALVFGAKDSTGVMLPILIFADIFAIMKYHQHADWAHLKPLLLFALIGIVIGTYVGQLIPEPSFRQLMVFIIFVCLGIMVWQELSKKIAVPQSKYFAISIGVLGGFATMVGNLAGPIMILYFLAMRFEKNRFIGTGAWFFFVINVSKLPSHIVFWETINLNTILLGISLIPFIGIGAFLGIKLVKTIPETLFRRFIIAITALSALSLLA